MRTVYKYPVALKDDWMIMLPGGAKILSLHMQDGSPFMWVAVETDRAPVKRYFRTAGTGHEIVGNLRFIDTFQLENLGLVFHVFEKV